MIRRVSEHARDVDLEKVTNVNVPLGDTSDSVSNLADSAAD